MAAEEMEKRRMSKGADGKRREFPTEAICYQCEKNVQLTFYGPPVRPGLFNGDLKSLLKREQ